MNTQSSSQPSQHTRIDVAETKQTTTTPPVSMTQVSNPTMPVTTTLACNPQLSVLFNQGDCLFVEYSCD